ncbi:MAG TPA: GTPase HflX [Candidatus Oscillibacter excrementigallinarum]|uniref:GTPase HflX n=1 Tax=Candidatus Oscillibacter excrementigallinarum TaxID=2838716 RepID=A0A9D2LKG6_9FIRM|nr:GTPase HflX [Candidatus Oscillibacter excrementigallinarum]
MAETQEVRDKVVLVGLNSPVLKKEENADEETMEELSALVETAGGETVGIVLQNRPSPDPRTFIGEGKVAEVQLYCENTGATMVIFDNDLSPSQMRVLTELLGVQVLDRCGLILDIFAQRAKTKEGRLQVELAQYQYLLPRLTGMWTHLERQAGTSGKGPIGSKGPGETQLETDRRHIRRKIDKLRDDLEEVRRVRSTQRQRRQKNEIPVVAIVGYTNAGKSTLLNHLTGAGIPANDRLFDTLDTTSRLLTVSDTLDVVISDTVGFIRKLPHQLVEAFKATLEELEYADLLLHVIDVSNPEWQQQAAVVENLIRELGAGELPRIDVFNKSDRLPAGEIMPHGEDICSISARTGEGVDKLLEMIAARLDSGSRRCVLHIPYDKGGLLDQLYREAKVENVEYGETIAVTAVCTPKVLGQMAPFIAE